VWEPVFGEKPNWQGLPLINTIELLTSSVTMQLAVSAIKKGDRRRMIQLLIATVILGAAFVLSLFALLIWRALRIVTLSKNLYGTLVAGGITAMLMFQVFVNVGMSLGIMPITGIPLPLMSYGGSSVLATFLAIGVLESVHMHARLSQKSRDFY